MMARKLAVMLTGAGALLAAGCSGLKSDAPAEQVYILRPGAAGVAATQPLSATLQVRRPAAQPGLDTNRIALTRPGNRLDYYAGSRWAGPLTDVVGALLAQSLRASGSFANVDNDRGGFGPDFVLAVTIRHFEAQYSSDDSAPRARVALEATLGSRRERETLANLDADVTVQADANRLGSVVAALEQAAQQATAELLAKSTAATAAALAAQDRPQQGPR